MLWPVPRLIAVPLLVPQIYSGRVVPGTARLHTTGLLLFHHPTYAPLSDQCHIPRFVKGTAIACHGFYLVHIYVIRLWLSVKTAIPPVMDVARFIYLVTPAVVDPEVVQRCNPSLQQVQLIIYLAIRRKGIRQGKQR